MSLVSLGNNMCFSLARPHQPDCSDARPGMHAIVHCSIQYFADKDTRKTCISAYRIVAAPGLDVALSYLTGRAAKRPYNSSTNSTLIQAAMSWVETLFCSYITLISSLHTALLAALAAPCSSSCSWPDLNTLNRCCARSSPSSASSTLV